MSKAKRQNQPTPRTKSNPAPDPPANTAEEGNEFFWRALAREPVAIGIALIVFFRPWRDGLTYMSFNTYFLWVTLLLAALWGARQLFRGEPIRFGVPTLMFAAFLIVAFLTGLDTVQVDATYRALLYWSGHFFLFVLCANTLRTPLSFGIVLGAFVVSATANALWSIIHFHYMLPMLREEVMRDPSVLQRVFSASQLTPELKHRLEVNRAFGSLLFPNALAAFMILALPYVVGEMWPTFSKMREAWRNRLPAGEPRNPDQETRNLYVSAAVGLGAWFVTAASAFFLYPFLMLIIAREVNWLAHPVQTALYLGLIPIAVGAYSLMVTRRHGLRFYRLTLQSALLPFALVAQSISLFLTYSRGGAMGLALALIVGTVLFLWGRKRLEGVWLKRAATAAGVIGALAVLLPATGYSQVPDPPTQPAQPSPGLSTDNVKVEGLDLGIKELTNPSSLRLRFGYWKVAWSIIKANPWTGVGLGNFGTVYAKHQHRGAGETQMAHNDYIQLLAETGPLGLLAFLIFWAYFVVWGARRIIRERSARYRWLLTGMYVAVAAFLIHSLVDFNFYNPALVTPMFFMAGVFYARAAALAPESDYATGLQKKTANQLVALPVLVAVALIMGAGVRVYFVDFALTEGTWWEGVKNIGSRRELHQRVQVSRFFIEELPKKPNNPKQPPYQYVRDAGLLIDDLQVLRSFGVIRVPQPGDPPSLRPVGQNELIPPNALLFIRDRELARSAAIESSEYWLRRIRMADSIYPYIPDVAMVAFEWYDMLQSNARDRETKRKYADKALEWARKGVERNPEQAWFHEWLGKALLLQGNLASGEEAIEFYERGVEEFARAKDLYSISHHAWRQYATALSKVGTAFVESGRTRGGGRFEGDDTPSINWDALLQKGERMIEKAEQARKRAQELRKPPPNRRGMKQGRAGNAGAGAARTQSESIGNP